jgi:hypothetical protein
MNWDCELLVTNSNPVILPCAFTSQLLAVEVMSTNQRNTWFSAGYLQSFALWESRKFLGKKFKLGFGEQLIEIPYAKYQLQFQAEYWLENTLIRIQQLSTNQINSIMPLYAQMPTEIGDRPVLDSLPTTFAAPAYAAANPPATYQCLAANTARQSFAVNNQGTANVFLDLDAPTTATKRFITITPGSAYISDFVFQGAVFIWSSNGAAQSCEIRELIQ